MSAISALDESSTASSKPEMPKIEIVTSHSSSSRFSLLRPNKLTESQEAELIAKATAQAMIAARSIILSGGTQTTALSTAKAAAQSVMGQKSGPQTPNSTSFMGRRKVKRQASIIASMALGSVNNSLQKQHAARSEQDSIDLSAKGQTYQNWDAAKMLTQGLDLPAFLGYESDSSYMQDRTFAGQSRSKIMASSFGSRSPSSQQPSAMATTVSGSQATTAQSSPRTIGSIGKNEAKTSVASTLPNSTEEIKSVKSDNNADSTLEVKPSVASILTSLASLSDIGSTQSPISRQSENAPRTKGIVEYLKNRKSTVDDSKDGESLAPLKKLPAEMPLPRSRTKDLVSLPSEDPIYVVNQRPVHKLDYKSFTASKRMEQFLQHSLSYDSHGDSYSGGSSTYASHESDVLYTQGSGGGETGTADSCTEESETCGSTTYQAAGMGATVETGESFFGLPSTNVFSSISDAFFCSAVPRLQKDSRTISMRESRDEQVVEKVSNPRSNTSNDLRGRGSCGSSTFERDMSLSDGEEDLDAGDVPEKDILDQKPFEYKRLSVQESMEQLVLRALSATPAAASSVSNTSRVKSSLTRENSVAERSATTTPAYAELTTEHTDSGLSSKTGTSTPVNRRIKMPNWVRVRKANLKTSAKDIE